MLVGISAEKSAVGNIDEDAVRNERGLLDVVECRVPPSTTSGRAGEPSEDFGRCCRVGSFCSSDVWPSQVGVLSNGLENRYPALCFLRKHCVSL